jgi:YVTN family beta-propeller protein
VRAAHRDQRRHAGDAASLLRANLAGEGPGAHGVVVDGAGRYAYVTNIYDNTVSVLDARSAKVVAKVPVGRAPNGISVMP